MKRQILVVEDNELNRAMLCEILSGEYQVLEAGNGQEALDILRQHRDRISLILLDIMMPVMDGYTFLERVREDAELSSVPVIVMTQSSSEDDEVIALAHGATDFVPKPYRPSVILHRAASLIKLRETAAMVNQFKYDRLTGLYSWEYFCQKVRAELAQHPERQYGLICANVEKFKLFKDAYGVQASNQLLKEIADAFRPLFSDGGICCRYRADRFIGLQERNEAYHYRIAHGQDGRFCSLDTGKDVMIKWGAYEIEDGTVPVELMCDRAMLAVDSIKGQYNQYYCVYDDSMRSRMRRDKVITDAMESALAQEQFTVYFQPKYSLNGDCMAGAEALVRWQHPELGFISPGEFIPLFEENGFVSQLDQYVWEKVCAQMQDWQQKGYPRLPVSVNVSRADMLRPHLEKTLEEIVRRYGVEPSDLHLEITESVYSDQLDQIIGTVVELRRRGFLVEMDDFCSGYSSLNMLSQMDLDILKLDMKFVQNETGKPAGQSILNDVITMAHRLNLTVVAEGVETRSQMERLRDVSCDMIQGYYFARPMTADAFEKLLETFRMHREEPVKAMRDAAERRYLLLAEEDDAHRKRVGQVLSHQYAVLEAADAESAIRYLRACGTDGIQAVLLSMSLPEDGASAVMDVLRQEPEFWPIPVLATIPNGGTIDEMPTAMKADDFLFKGHPLFDLARRVQRTVDFASFNQRERLLRDEANRDPLTNLLNRRGLQAALARVEEGDLPMAVYLFDLDDLKRVNEDFGHEAGDQMICAFADLIRRQTRAEDIQSRYGGDGFLVILKQFSSLAAIESKGSRICQAFAAYQLPDGSRATCSCGIALCSMREGLEESIRRADAALSQAKKEQRGGCRLWKKAQTPVS